jgi:hypothetical protein
MNRLFEISLVGVVLILLAACSSEPRYIQPKSDSAFLQNRTETQGQARFVYFFEYANGLDISPSDWALKMPAKIKSKIYPGETVVGVQVIYTPAFGRNIFARMNDRMFYIFARDLGFTEERLAYISENTSDVEYESLTSLRGLRFNAEVGVTYRAAAKVADGRAYLWIEDTDGNAVSETVVGVTDPYCVTQSVYDAGTIACMANLSHGWTVLEGLPDPFNSD